MQWQAIMIWQRYGSTPKYRLIIKGSDSIWTFLCREALWILTMSTFKPHDHNKELNLKSCLWVHLYIYCVCIFAVSWNWWSKWCASYALSVTDCNLHRGWTNPSCFPWTVPRWLWRGHLCWQNASLFAQYWICLSDCVSQRVFSPFIIVLHILTPRFCSVLCFARNADRLFPPLPIFWHVF